MNVTNILNHALHESGLVTVNGLASGDVDGQAYLITLLYSDTSIWVMTGDWLLGDTIEIGTERVYLIPESIDDEFNKRLSNEYVLSYETDLPILIKLYEMIAELKATNYFRD